MITDSPISRRPRIAPAVAGVLLAAAMLLAPAADALAAAPYPIASAATITSAFTPAAIPAGGTSSLSVTITNPNTAANLSGIGFSDALPSGLVVDDPNGQSGTCGSAGVLTANPGSSTISLNGGKLAAGASCTVSANVTAASPGSFRNVTGPVNSTEAGAGAGAGDAETLSVIGAPAITLASPAPHATFAFGQKVKARYSCREAAGGPGILDCSGDASSGARIDTSIAGAQTFTVTAVSADGAVTTDTVPYTVRPDNRFTVSQVKPQAGGVLTFALKLPGPGRVTVRETAPGSTGRVTFGQRTLEVARARRLGVSVTPSAQATQLISALAGAGATNGPVVRLSVTYKPKGGRSRTLTVRGIQFP